MKYCYSKLLFGCLEKLTLSKQHHGFKMKCRPLFVLLQVCIEGTAEQLPDALAKEYFQSAPVSHRVRELMNLRGQCVNWDDVKKLHDEIYSKLLCNQMKSKCPEHL